MLLEVLRTTAAEIYLLQVSTIVKQIYIPGPEIGVNSLLPLVLLYALQFLIARSALTRDNVVFTEGGEVIRGRRIKELIVEHGKIRYGLKKYVDYKRMGRNVGSEIDEL